eukprot:360838-Chlamydomonas_euryale.AAC.7
MHSQPERAREWQRGFICLSSEHSGGGAGSPADPLGRGESGGKLCGPAPAARSHVGSSGLASRAFTRDTMGAEAAEGPKLCWHPTHGTHAPWHLRHGARASWRPRHGARAPWQPMLVHPMGWHQLLGCWADV